MQPADTFRVAVRSGPRPRTWQGVIRSLLQGSAAADGDLQFLDVLRYHGSKAWPPISVGQCDAPRTGLWGFFFRIRVDRIRACLRLSIPSTKSTCCPNGRRTLNTRRWSWDSFRRVARRPNCWNIRTIGMSIAEHSLDYRRDPPKRGDTGRGFTACCLTSRLRLSLQSNNHNSDRNHSDTGPFPQRRAFAEKCVCEHGHQDQTQFVDGGDF